MFQIVNGYHGPSDWDGISNFSSITDHSTLVSTPTRVEGMSTLQRNEEANAMDPQLGSAVVGAMFSYLGMLPSLFGDSSLKYIRGGLIFNALVGVLMCSEPLLTKWNNDEKITSSDWFSFGQAMAITGVSAVLGFRVVRSFDRSIIQSAERRYRAGSLIQTKIYSDAIATSRLTQLLLGSAIPLMTSFGLYTGIENLKKA